MQKISEEEELEHEREIPLKALTAPDEDEYGGVEMNVDLMAERELQDVNRRNCANRRRHWIKLN